MTTEPAITHGEIVQQTETSEPDLIPPGADMEFVGESATDQVARLQIFLEERFPEEVTRTNRQVKETPVETAMRLLSGLATQGTMIQRCAEEYCNKSLGHTDHHGWVHHT